MGRSNAGGADVRRPLGQRAGVEAELGDQWLAKGCLRSSASSSCSSVDQRVALRVPADADAREGMGDPGELLQQVAGVGVVARRRVGVAADHEHLADTRALDPLDQPLKVAAAA